MVAVPTFMSESLKKAKGGYGHAALQAGKGAAQYVGSMVAGQPKEKS